MQDYHLFEYAVIRVMPRVEREEFLNVGVILFCAKQSFLRTLFILDDLKLKSFSSHLDIEELKQNLIALERISLADKLSGPIGLLDKASRFRWLTATRSTVIQCSKVHPGLCIDADQTLIRLFNELAL